MITSPKNERESQYNSTKLKSVGNAAVSWRSLQGHLAKFESVPVMEILRISLYESP